MQLVDNDTFLKELAVLFDSSKTGTGSIWLTHKRLSYDGDDTTMKSVEGVDDDDPREYPCLVRVSDGGKIKFSTTITSSQLPKFHQTYSTLLKSSLSPHLRKRDKKREKQRQEQFARRKRKLMLLSESEGVVVGGAKRGRGRRQRQRKVRALVRGREILKRGKEREEAKGKVEEVKV